MIEPASQVTHRIPRSLDVALRVPSARKPALGL
jgi:hypothetical protein